MSRILAFGERLLPALLIAAAVSLLTAGMAAWPDPGVGARGHTDISSNVASLTPDPGDADPGGDAPESSGVPGADGATSRPTERLASTDRPRRTPRQVAPTERPTPPPPTPSPSPAPTPAPALTATPTSTPTLKPAAAATPEVPARPTASPLRTAQPTPTPRPSPAPTPSPSPSLRPTPSPSPTVRPTPSPSPTITPAPAPRPTPTLQPTASPAPADPVVATRIVIASQDIDLPIISRDKRISGQGPDKYPPCDVAIYHTAFQQPGDPGTTYIYAHARDGMFLPLLLASQHRDGDSLIGSLVQVYTSDDHEYVYQITQVKRHALDFSLALDAPRGSQQLILQTSEGPRGTVPKLQVLAEPVDVLQVSHREATPRAHPRACYSTP
jgi:hypothetical protein